MTIFRMKHRRPLRHPRNRAFPRQTPWIVPERRPPQQMYHLIMVHLFTNLINVKRVFSVHVATQHPSSNTATADPLVIPKRGRPPGKDTIQSRFTQPNTTEIPIPIQDFTCPLCQETIGRKAISTHLRTVYQVERPKKFRFSPQHDMMPGRFSCIHCKASFTMPFALTNHFDRGTCPQLVLNWVRDTHYGPPVDSSRASVRTPAMQMNQVQHYSCGLILGSTATSSHGPLRNFAFGIARPLAFHPEARLLWYAHTAAWTTNFHRLPQVQLCWTPIYAIVVQVISQMPCRWAWTSANHDTWWDPSAQNVPDDFSSQQRVFEHALLELEHVLSRHCVLSSIDHALTREYVRRRSLISRSSGRPGIPCQEAQNADWKRLYPDQWQGTLQRPLQLLGFIIDVGTRSTRSTSGQVVSSSGRYA